MKNIHQLQKELTFGTGELWTVEDKNLRCFYRSKGRIFNISGNCIKTNNPTYYDLLHKEAKIFGYMVEKTSDAPGYEKPGTYRITRAIESEFSLVQYVKSLENTPSSNIASYLQDCNVTFNLHKDIMIPIFPSMKHINPGYYGLRFGMKNNDIGSRVFSVYSSRNTAFKLSAVITDPSEAMTRKVSNILTDNYHKSTLSYYSLSVKKNELAVSVSVDNADENRMIEFMRLLEESGLRTIFSLIHNDVIMGVR